jgi:hypothetical protein
VRFRPFDASRDSPADIATDQTENTLNLINGYGQLLDPGLSGRERREQFVAFIVDLLGSQTVNAIPDGSPDLTDADRLVFVLGGRRYILDIVWPDRPLATDALAQFVASATTSPGDPRHVLLCMSGFEDHATDGGMPAGSAPVVLLDRTHLEALVYGVFVPSELLDAAFDRAFLTGRPLVRLTELLVEPPPPDTPARMFRPDHCDGAWR